MYEVIVSCQQHCIMDLYTDTGSLTEIVHPLDRDLRDEANFDPAIMRKLRNANLSLEELEVAGAALLHTDYVEEFRAAIVKVGQCDPNILGLSFRSGTGSGCD